MIAGDQRWPITRLGVVRAALYIAVRWLHRFVGDLLDALAQPLAGHEYTEAEPSPSGKSGYRCVRCQQYSNAPVRPLYASCPAKFRRVPS